MAALLLLPIASEASDGGLLFGAWRAWSLGGATRLVLVRNTAETAPTNALDAPYVQPTLLRRYLQFRFSGFLLYGEQPSLELAIDEACKRIEKNPAGLPAKEMKDAAREFLGSSGAETLLKNPEKETPYIAGSMLSALGRIEPIRAKLAPGEKEPRALVVAAVASCKEKAGKRFELAQKRGFHAQLSNNIRAFTKLVEDWITKKVPGATTEADRAALKARSIAISLKTIATTREKMKEYNRWLHSSEGAELGGMGTWEAPVVGLAREYARALTELLEKQESGLTRAYQEGHTQDAKAYPALSPKVALAEGDLDFLFE